MAFVRKQLAQSRPANTTAVSAVTGIDQQIVVIQSVMICNTTASDATYRLFHDDDGTTYSEATALCYDTNLPANTSVLIEFATAIDGGLYLTTSAANFAVRTGTNSALTFTIYGGIFKN